MANRLKQLAPVIVTLALLAYIGGFARLEIVTTGLAEYRERSRAAILAMPRKIGDWLAESHEIDPEARSLLKPNAEFNFRYENQRTRQQAFYTVVQVTDARHMTGHAPVNCYPGNGWTILSEQTKTWKLGEFDVRGIEYRMTRRRNGQVQRWNIRNFFIFPDGTFGCTLRDLDHVAEDYRRLAYGATQVQFITHDALPEAQREEAFNELVGSEKSLDMFRTLRTGIRK